MHDGKISTEHLDFPIHPEYSKNDIQKVQKTLLEMGKTVCSILERHNIPHMIAFGTLLGAVRLKGFFPWDDDFDLFLFDDSYDSAMAHLECELPSHLIVHSEKNDPLYFKAWNTVKNLRTRTIDAGLYNRDNTLLRFPCIHVDMYRLKKINPKQAKKYKLEEAIHFFRKKKELSIISESLYELNIKKLYAELNECNSTQQLQQEVSNSYMFMLKMKSPVTNNDIFPLKKYGFEGNFFRGPNNAEAFLKSAYGDYKILPSYKFRRSHYTKVVFL